MSAPIESALAESVLIGALLQEHDPVFSVCQAHGITEASFTIERCARAWRTMERMRAERKPIELMSVASNYGDNACDAMIELEPMFKDCVTTAHATYYAQEVRNAERRRELHTAARMAVEQLDKGGAVEVVAANLREAGEAVAGGAGGARIVAAQDFMAEPIPEPPQVIRSVFRAGQVGMIASTAKGGKTWLMQTLALAVPNGLRWLKWQTTPGRVLYVDPELPAYDGQTRFLTVADALGLDCIPDGLDLWRVKGETISIRDMIPKILLRQKQVGKPYSLILLDSLYCLNGGRDENDNTEQAKTMQELYALTAQTGAAVLVTHHFSKGNKAKTDHLDRASGAGVFTRAPDVFMTLTPHKEPDCYSVETTCRSFARPDPFVIRWTFPLWSLADELDPDHLKRPGAGRGPQFTPQQIVDLLPADGLSHADWWAKAKAQVKCGKTTFNNLLAKARADKLVMECFGKYLPGALGAEEEKI